MTLTGILVKLSRLLVLQVLLGGQGHAYMVGNNPHHRVEMLDGRGNYRLEWKVDWEHKHVIINVTVKTKGYVGFGMTDLGKMTGADIVIGGVAPDGRTYFSDRHAVATNLPEEDASQDWILHGAWETLTHTFLSFSRDFDTCDSKDYPITEDKISLIWAYGEHDKIAYHYQNRGEYPVYLLYPDYTPSLVKNPFAGIPTPNRLKLLRDSNTKVWTVTTKHVMPPREAAYWCTMHKGPSLIKKHHMIGFEVIFPNEQSRQHVHHLGLHRCTPPRGQDASKMFAPFLESDGQLCFSLRTPTGPMPTEYCTQFFNLWGVGGRPFFLPPNVGLPLGEEVNEYFVLQVHYDNPELISNMMVTVEIDYHYTSDLRPNDGSVMVYRHELPGVTPSYVIPPSSLNHQIYGFCGSECTHEILPPQGIRMFGMFLHAHNSAVGMRFQQFRNNEELPWLASDSNFAFNYQQTKPLIQERRMLPGDTFALRCTYDNTATNGTVVGGFSSRQEMCAVFFYYYTRIKDHFQCSSEIISPEGRSHFLGIGNVTWSMDDLEFIVDPPDKLAGKRVSQISDNYVKWDTELREELQRFHLQETQVNRCPQELYGLPATNDSAKVSSGRAENEVDPKWRTVRYPYEARPYQPEPTCSFRPSSKNKAQLDLVDAALGAIDWLLRWSSNQRMPGPDRYSY